MMSQTVFSEIAIIGLVIATFLLFGIGAIVKRLDGIEDNLRILRLKSGQ